MSGPKPRQYSSLPILLLTVVVVGSACGDRGPSIADRAAATKAAEAAADAKAREATSEKLEAQRLTALWRYQKATVGWRRADDGRHLLGDFAQRIRAD